MQKRWRAKQDYGFYHVDTQYPDGSWISGRTEKKDERCDAFYNSGNYSQSPEDAKEAAEEVKKVFLRRSGQLHDFTWAVDKMKRGDLLTLPDSDVVYTYDEKDGFQFVCEEDVDIIDFDYFDCEFGAKEIFSTDWEIYKESVR